MEIKLSHNLSSIAQNSFDYLRQWKVKTGRKIIGYFCTNNPEEMIHAAGFLPVRVLTSRDSISLASRHLQSYSCSLVQSSLESALRGDLSFLDGTVFPHTCDSMQRLSDIWAENLKFPFHWDLVLPVKLNSGSARDYLIQELRRFRAGLETYLGHSISEEQLRASITLFNDNRALLRDVYFRRMDHPEKISASDFFLLIKTATFMPKEEHNAQLKSVLSSISAAHISRESGIRLFVAGSVCDHLSLYSLLDSAGAPVAGDDLCTGWRYISDDVSLNGDPIHALADRLLRKVPCPCKYNPEIDRAEHLLKRVKDCGAKAVVFLLLKYCDPHAFDYPYLREKLDRGKIRSLLLEIEPGGIPLGALETRLKAFLETLES